MPVSSIDHYLLCIDIFGKFRLTIRIMEHGKIQLESIPFEPGKSFRIFSPRLRNTFLWHYHPEFELVYVEADAGIRHVGTHISTYTQNDLVFIGGNLPHLNFDYRLRSDYHQIVVQLRCDFMGTALGLAPELSDIAALFKDAAYGIAFDGDTKLAVAGSAERTILNHDLESRNFILKDKIRMGAVYEYIDAHYHSNPDVNVVARKVNLTTPAFCRYFKRQTNMTFTDFLNQYRIERAKNLLMQGDNVSETCYAIGLDSLSYFNKLFKALTGENPSDFRKRIEGGDGK